jgi:cell wall assembly regulator SMI1
MVRPMQTFMTDFAALPPASEEALRTAERDIGTILPDDYRLFLLEHNGGDGFIGDNYLILWRAEELSKFNDGYEVSKYAPGFLVFGSTGGGDGFAFDMRTSPNRVMQVPFVGMSIDDDFLVAGSFNELLNGMHEAMNPTSRLPKKVRWPGKEIFEIQPVLLGGSPTDPENKMVLTRDQHMEAVRYWNKAVNALRNQQAH